MPLTLDYTGLLTENEVVEDAVQSTRLNIGDHQDEIVRAIEDVTSRIEEHVGRELIVREQILRFRQAQWSADERYTARDALDFKYVAFVPQWPVVEVLEVDGSTDNISDIDILDGGRKVGYDSSTVIYKHPAFIKAYAGYRRRDQVLTDLTGTDAGEGSLTNLTVLPAQLPGKIREAALKLVLHRLFAAESKQFGTGRRSQQIGGQGMATVESVDVGFEERVLSQLETGVSVLA